MTSSNSLSTKPTSKTMSAQPLSNWNIMDFYRQSIQLLKQNPKLLLLAIAMIMLVSGSSFSSSGSGSSSSTPSQEEPSEVQIEETLEKTMRISEIEDNVEIESSLSTNKLSSSLVETNQPTSLLEDGDPASLTDLPFNPEIELPQWLDNLAKRMPEFGEEAVVASRSAPNWIYFFFGFQVLIMMVFGLGLSLATAAWAQAAMIEGVNQANKIGHNRWRLANVTNIALHKIKPTIWVTYVPLIKVIVWIFFMIVAISFLIGMGASIVKSNLTLGMMFLTSSPVAGFFILKHLMKIGYAQILAMRLVVFQELKGKQAFTQAMDMIKSQGFLSKSFLLSLTHGILLSTIAPLILLTPLVIAGGMYLKQYLPQFIEAQPTQLPQLILSSFTPGWIGLLISALLMTTMLQLGFSVIALVIKYANWHWACRYFFNQTIIKENTQPTQINQ